MRRAALDDLQMPVELVRTGRPARGWRALAVLGLLACAAEGIWFSQDLWLAQAGVRAALSPVLDRFGLSLRRPVLAGAWQVDAMTLHARPEMPGAWRVDALLVQHAGILQPWPVLRLDFRDWRGQAVARRDLPPAEYLPADTAGALAAPDRPLRIAVGVALPAAADGSPPGFEQVSLKVRP